MSCILSAQLVVNKRPDIFPELCCQIPALQDPSVYNPHPPCWSIGPSWREALGYIELLLTMALWDRYGFDVPIVHAMNTISVSNVSPTVQPAVHINLPLIPIESSNKTRSLYLTATGVPMRNYYY